MYQEFNAEKNRWQKFDKNGRLLGTKKTEGPYVKVPTKEDWLKAQEEVKPSSETTTSEASKDVSALPQDVSTPPEGVSASPQDVSALPSKNNLEEVGEKVSEEAGEKEKVKQASAKASKKEAEKSKSKATPETKTVEQWLIDVNLRLITDNGVLKPNELTLESKITQKAFDRLLPSFAVAPL